MKYARREREGLRVEPPVVVTCQCGMAIYIYAADYAELSRLTEAGKQDAVYQSVAESAAQDAAEASHELEVGH